ncbi:MAG TPA: NAD(P)H-binding protein [Polyangiaceae bacterium]|nr:NAD(P)H-binding protein [Polyangiaceae bacterium]
MTKGKGGVALVTGASGFIGGALIPALRARGFQVVATSRRHQSSADGLVWRTCDLLDPASLPAAFAGVRVAYYLVHSMGGRASNFRDLERRTAEAFVASAAKARVERIVYLGGPAPPGVPSEHLRSRLEVGEILRAGPVPVAELRASMVIGHGSASWQIVRDLAVRLPVMVLPKWLGSRTRPVALQDVVEALVSAADLPLSRSEWFDLPGPEVMNGQQILERIAALRGRHFLALKVPFLSPQLSALWLRLITRTDFALARELVLGLQEDLLPKDERFWSLIEHTQLVSFDAAARYALASE